MAPKRILLHICCGPCAIYPVQALREQGFEVIGLYFNPNIHPLQEYLKRREGLVETAERLKLKVIYKDADYDPKTYLRAVAFREANRCFHCYTMRLEKTWSVAKRGGFDAFSTTLLYSKFQKHELIASLGRDIAGQGQTAFHYQDFRQGWKQGIDLSKEWGIYRQQYCGCIYSEMERYHSDLEKVIEKK
ncbi:MAG: epoxyqueuosine reductase QueH [Desulfoplanes sp.]|nr:epoxyqueuosine reductase QueH [Desulfoplanes sp.]